MFRERHNIDILVLDEANGYVCPIENKIESGEHSNQLSRYLRIVKRTYPELSPLPVFLTPGGGRPARRTDAEQYAPLSYGTIAELINRLRFDKVAGRHRQCHGFSQAVRTHHPETSDEHAR